MLYQNLLLHVLFVHRIARPCNSLMTSGTWWASPPQKKPALEIPTQKIFQKFLHMTPIRLQFHICAATHRGPLRRGYHLMALNADNIDIPATPPLAYFLEILPATPPMADFIARAIYQAYRPRLLTTMAVPRREALQVYYPAHAHARLVTK